MDRSRVFRSRYRWFGALLPLVMWSASVIASSDIPPIHDGAWRDIRRADGKSVPVYYANLDDAIDAEFRALCESEPE
ncbi:hypothetical protein, partial [Dyella sp.]|uniref:hypothetical protein n=1 Tax=Dyella sp. TaxID=1869338 RepID=UPI002ED2163E